MAKRQKFFFFLKRQIWQNEAINFNILTGGYKFFCAIGEHHIGISHENHRHFYIIAKFFDKCEYFICCNASAQRPNVCFLNNRSFGSWIGERDAKLNEIRTVFYSGTDSGGCRFQIRVTASDKGDKRLAVFKCFFDVTHEDPPLCNGQWLHSPCRLCRIW